MQLYDFKQKRIEFSEKLEIIKNKFAKLGIELDAINAEQADPSFWENTDKVAQSNKKKRAIEKKLEKLQKTQLAVEDYSALIELTEENSLPFSEKELLSSAQQTELQIQNIWVDTLLSKEYDSGPAIITLHSGAGGEEAQDWAEMLARMYERYAEAQGFDVTILECTSGDGAGIKSESFLIEGENAYGYLKAEKGVHRLVRLSPFDANNRRHTSFASLEVAPFIEENRDVTIKSEEIKIDTYRSSGAGGQHVNKTDSAVRITHLPTGIVVQCQNERSQIQNKEMAMKILVSKLMEKNLAEKEAEKQKKLGENKKIEWGSQIRSYILHPYNLVKDHRTNYETSDTEGVLGGDIQPFINEYLRVFE